MPPSSTLNPTPLRASPPPLELRSWPLAEAGKPLVLFVLAAATVAGLVWWATEREMFVAVALLLLAGGCWQLFVPSVYELDAMGVTVQSLGRRHRVPWNAIDRAEIGGGGVRFVADGVALAPLRGLYVPWGTRRDEVLAILDYYLPAALRTS